MVNTQIKWAEHAWLILLAIACMLMLSACATTSQQISSSSVPKLAELNDSNITSVLVADRTRLHHLHEWWGRPAAQGESGDFQWYNYTYVGEAQQTNSKPGDTQMISLTVYFERATGLLADYDFQLHQFPAHMNNN